MLHLCYKAGPGGIMTFCGLNIVVEKVSFFSI